MMQENLLDLEQEAEAEVYGGWLPGKMIKTPFSDAMEKVERQVSGLFAQDGTPLLASEEEVPERRAFESDVLLAVERREVRTIRGPGGVDLHASFDGRAGQISETMAQTIPPDLTAAYRMSEWVYNSEGDVKQAIDIPMDLSIRPVQVEDGDPKVAARFQALYSPDWLNLDALIPDIWLSRDLYGVSYVMELWDQKLPDPFTLKRMLRGEIAPIKANLQQLSLLNPKFMYVGRLPFTGSQSYSFSPTDNDGLSFRRQLVDQTAPPITYNALIHDLHEYLVYAWNVAINPSCITMLRDKANSFTRYPWPRLMSVFRTVTTRQVLEEMVRATIEGSKNQLWFFGLGPPDGSSQPSDAEMNALRGTVGSSAGERTGQLAWRGWLRVEVHAPKVEPAMVENKWRQLTDHILHQMGISRQIVSGSDAQMQAVTADDIDVKVLIERMTARRNQIDAYLASLTRKICLFSGEPDLIRRVTDPTYGKKPPVARMADFGLDTESAIKNKILPLYQAGLTSPQTALKSAGHNYDAELTNHKSADKDAFTPPATYAQAVVKEGQMEKTSHGPMGDKAPGKRTTKPKASAKGSEDE